MSDKSTLLVSSALRLAHGGIYHRRGDNVRCLEMARQALDEARAAGEPASEARALHRLHLATVYLRWPDTERFGPRALALFEKLEDHERAASVLNNLGIEAYFNGDWTEAIDCYARSATECERAGNTLDLALAKLNTAELLSEQGHWERAADLFADAGRNFASAGYSAGLGANDLFSGVNERRQERWAEAEHLIQRALDRFRDLGLAELEDDAESRLVELAMFRGHADLDRIDALLARFGEQHPLSRRMRWIRAITLCTVGRTSEGITELRALLPESEGVELARTSEVLIELCPDDADAEEWKSTMEEEYRRAGVVVRPHVPIGDHQKG
jgi:tetratricopeptide (TPR) repeat protein